MPGSWVTQTRDPKGTTTGGEWTEDGAAVWARALPRGQRDALLTYASNGYHNINASLRAGDLPSEMSNTLDRVADLDETFSSAPPLVQEATVYRGMALRGFSPEVGATFTDKAFISTSLDATVANRFSEYAIGNGADPGDVAIAEIRVPKGTKGVAMFRVWEAHAGKGAGGGSVSEREVILSRGSRFRVTKVGRDRKGRRRLALELLDRAA